MNKTEKYENLSDLIFAKIKANKMKNALLGGNAGN